MSSVWDCGMGTPCSHAVVFTQKKYIKIAAPAIQRRHGTGHPTAQARQVAKWPRPRQRPRARSNAHTGLHRLPLPTARHRVLLASAASDGAPTLAAMNLRRVDCPVLSASATGLSMSRFFFEASAPASSSTVTHSLTAECCPLTAECSAVSPWAPLLASMAAPASRRNLRHSTRPCSAATLSGRSFEAGLVALTSAPSSISPSTVSDRPSPCSPSSKISAAASLDHPLAAASRFGFALRRRPYPKSARDGRSPVALSGASVCTEISTFRFVLVPRGFSDMSTIETVSTTSSPSCRSSAAVTAPSANSIICAWNFAASCDLDREKSFSATNAWSVWCRHDVIVLRPLVEAPAPKATLVPPVTTESRSCVSSAAESRELPPTIFVTANLSKSSFLPLDFAWASASLRDDGK
eukprot:m.81605 g.81605  ORF g.81605 m.81605 type:complete len:409 (+) comp19485_c0_seq1:259-1485(+)